MLTVSIPAGVLTSDPSELSLSVVSDKTPRFPLSFFVFCFFFGGISIRLCQKQFIHIHDGQILSHAENKISFHQVRTKIAKHDETSNGIATEIKSFSSLIVVNEYFFFTQTKVNAYHVSLPNVSNALKA